MIPFWIFIGLILLVVFWFMSIYNGLVSLRNRTKEAFSDIDVALKRRYDLIQNLVETVKGYAAHEKDTLQKVTDARSRAMQVDPSSIAQKAQAENVLTGALKSLFAVAENYPNLKANENFLKLQEELSNTENIIQNSRMYYNGNVRDFNTKIEVFPNNLISSNMGFAKFEFFEAAQGEKEAVKVKF